MVDDDADMRLLLSTCSASAGFRVTEAGDGDVMDACLAQADVDLVLLDLRLPGGRLSLLRKISCQHVVRVIIVSGRGELLDRVVGLEVGADDYITKPLHLQELLARVRSVQGRQSSDPAHPAATGNASLTLTAARRAA